MPYTSDDLVTAVRRRTRNAEASDITAAIILELADQEQSSTCADILRNVDSGYWAATKSHSIISGVSAYRVAGRSFGAGIEFVKLVDANGNEEPVTPIELHDAWRYAKGRDALWNTRFAFVLIDDDVTLFPPPTTADTGLTLSIRYQRQPSQLVAVASCARATAVSGTAITTTGTIPGTIAFGVRIDYIRGEGSYPIDAEELSVLSVSSPTINVTTAFPISPYTSPSEPRRDYVALSGQSPYPRIPASLWPVLVSATCRALCEALGDRDGMMAAEAVLAARAKSAVSTHTPRSQQMPAMVPHDSFLRRGRWTGR